MAKPGNTGIIRIIRAAGFSFKGLYATFKHEAAFRQEVLLVIVLLPVAWWLADNHLERALLIGPLIIVLIVELLNSAIEAIVDRIGPEHHELSGRAKDIGSAAVFISLLNVVIIWTLVVLY